MAFQNIATTDGGKFEWLIGRNKFVPFQNIAGRSTRFCSLASNAFRVAACRFRRARGAMNEFVPFKLWLTRAGGGRTLRVPGRRAG
jgi:hypothetical protein